MNILVVDTLCRQGLHLVVVVVSLCFAVNFVKERERKRNT